MTTNAYVVRTKGESLSGPAEYLGGNLAILFRRMTDAKARAARLPGAAVLAVRVSAFETRIPSHSVPSDAVRVFPNFR